MSKPLTRIGGVVLCGGQSRRMGTPKAWLPCGREFLLQRVVRIVSQVVEPVAVAAHADQELPDLPSGVEVVHDAVEDCGPLAGIAAGLDALAGRCEAALITSCDHPLIRPAFLLALIDRLGDHKAVVPLHQGRWHPLTAVYRLDTRPILDELLATDDLRVRRYADRCGAFIIPAEELRAGDPDIESLWNVNDPQDYQRLARELDH